MNKKGFTVVELLTTIVLVAITATLLIQITTSLATTYSNTSAKTELYYKQSVISKDLNEIFIIKPILSINKCDNNCLKILYTDNSEAIVKIENNLIYIGNNTHEIVKNSEIGLVKMDIIYSPIPLNYKSDTILNIRIPITYNKFENDFGINFVYQYNRTNISVTL